MQQQALRVQAAARLDERGDERYFGGDGGEGKGRGVVLHDGQAPGRRLVHDAPVPGRLVLRRRRGDERRVGRTRRRRLYTTRPDGDPATAPRPEHSCALTMKPPNRKSTGGGPPNGSELVLQFCGAVTFNVSVLPMPPPRSSGGTATSPRKLAGVQGPGAWTGKPASVACRDKKWGEGGGRGSGGRRWVVAAATPLSVPGPLSRRSARPELQSPLARLAEGPARERCSPRPPESAGLP